MRNRILVIFLFFSITSVFGTQNRTNDSLKYYTIQQRIVSLESINSLKDLTFAYIEKSNLEKRLLKDTAQYLATLRKAIKIAKKTNDRDLIAYSLYEQRLALYRAHTSLQLFNNYNKPLKEYQEDNILQDSTNFMLHVFWGKVYLKQNYFIQALNEFNASLDYAYALNDSVKIARSLIKILGINNTLVDNYEFDKTNKLIVEYLPKQNYKLNILYLLKLRKINNKYTREQQDEFLLTARAYSKKINYKPFLLQKEMAFYYISHGNLDSALVVINALKKKYVVKNPTHHLHAAIHVTELEMRYAYVDGDIASSKKYFKKALDLTDELNSPFLKRELLLLALQSSEELKDYKVAFEALRSLKLLEDSTLNRSHILEYQRLKRLYQKKKTQQKITQLEHDKAVTNLNLEDKNKNILWLTFTLFSLLGILLIIFFYYNKKNASSKQLESLNQLKDTIFSVISHDLRSPLYNFQILLKMAQNKYLKEEEFEKYLKSIQIELTGVTSVTESLLRWAQSNQGLLQVNTTDVKLNDVCYEIKDIFKLDILEKDIHLINNFTKELTVSTDKDLFSFIIRNLIHNAVKFSSPKGRIVTNAIQTDTEITISVTDFGKGMTQDQLNNLNNKISKAGRDTKGFKSTGLGLLICKDFADKLDIKFSAKSIPNKETTFTLVIKK